MYLIAEFIVAGIEILLFSLLPFIIYLSSRRKVKGFFEYIGIKKCDYTWLYKGLIIVIFGLLTYSVPIMYLMKIGALESEQLAMNGFVNDEINIFLIGEIMIYAILQTSLSEEILFRGFFAKRLIGRFGFQKGNIIQGIIFGCFHGIVFIQYGPIAVGLMVILPSVMGYIFGYINEKKNNGSILPSWYIHGVTNIISPLFIILYQN